MEEITLSGGTLMGAGEANLGGSSGGNGGGSNGGHHHSHSHSHAGVTCDGNHDDNHNDNHNDNHGNMEMMDHSSLEELVNSSKEDIARALSTLFRFGRYEALTPLLEQLSQQKGTEALCDIIQVPDDGGHTLLHWAAKRVDDMRFLQSLVDLIVQLKRTDLLNTASADNVGMRPLHWACTEGSIPHLAVLLKHGADMEAKDTSGCTPLLIASQYGQVQVVAYLLKQGANGQAVDASWDTALHWAAYKGSIQVCGLLSFYQKLDWSTQDAYGQTPMHLAALRGHTSVVRYILAQLPKKKDILFVKDKNERTPLDLAIHKNRPTVETVLREAMAEVEDPRGHFFRKTIWSTLKECKSSKSWKNWLGLNPLSDEMDEPMRMPYYFVLFNFGLHFLFMITLFAPFTNAEKGILWDKSGWLLWNFVVTFCSWYTFYKTVKTKPGYLDDSHANIAKWRKMYEETLDAYADESQEGKLAAETPLCHTCHVARPLRSKHCRISRKCVLMFDHYCPFVDNTVGMYNYKWFFPFLMFMTLALGSFLITLIMYTRRYTQTNTMPWFTILCGFEIAICLLPIGGMLAYHTQLTMVNLTTNEHLNVRKYKYLYPTINGKRTYRNPWFKGWWGNTMDRFHPTDMCYMIPAERQGLTSSNNKTDNYSGDAVV